MHRPNRAALDAALLERIGLDRVRARQRARDRRSARTALAFMAPALLLVGLVLLLPVAFNVAVSFTRWKKFAGIGDFAGLANYAALGQNPFFGEALTNTAIWIVASVVFPLAFGLGLALFLRGIRFEELFKSIVFLPRILAPTAVGIIWYFFYAPAGVLNGLLGLFSAEPVRIGWLYQSSTVNAAIIATFVWQTVGLVMVLLLLGLNALPKDPVEAARIDGATPVQIFRHIVLPLLTPTILVVTIMSVLAGFTVFDLLWVMGISYPDQRTLSLAVYMYFEAFQKGSWAFGSAIAIVIAGVALGVTWLQALLQARVDRQLR